MNLEFLPIELTSATSALDPKSRQQWVHLFKLGENPARDGCHFLLGNADEVIAQTVSVAGSGHLPIDYEHQTDFARENGKPAPAAGWITKLENRSTGLWALVEWTRKAANMITSKEYRYISPTFNTDKSGKIVRVLRAGLTNNPALELTQLATRTETHTKKDTDMNFQEQVAKALGLNADADEDAIITALARTQSQSAALDKDDVAAVQEMVIGFNKERHEAQTTRIQEKIKLAVTSGIMPPGMKGWMTRLCTNDEAAFDDFIETIGKTYKPVPLSEFYPQVDQRFEDVHTTKNQDSEDHKIAQQLGISPDDMIEAKH